ncbi:MAG: hypothetical protein M0R30_03930 [Methanoregula sp.]|jgi:hypothetical protein|uniref:hypothetical protein n=1 Tax=Methanoregula sp. TaxID=2052170 RepID=UPI0025EF3610|nr:hypothetical protein [Methanoregula sp.]MCK9630770.1 hypothetical protein [Methanoregula sp.]
MTTGEYNRTSPTGLMAHDDHFYEHPGKIAGSRRVHYPETRPVPGFLREQVGARTFRFRSGRSPLRYGTLS